MKRFKTDMGKFLWKAAKCTTKAEFDAYMNGLKTANPKAAAYVDSIPAERWARCLFKAKRFGHLTSNIAESTNSWLEEARSLNPTQLICCFVRKVNILFHGRLQTYAAMDPNALPKNIASTLFDSIEKGRTLKVVQNSEKTLMFKVPQNRLTFASLTSILSLVLVAFPKRLLFHADISAQR